MPFLCSICGEESTRICARCTKDACNNHLCEKCLRCSDCCECEVALTETVRDPGSARAALRAVAGGPRPEPDPEAQDPEAAVAQPAEPEAPAVETAESEAAPEAAEAQATESADPEPEAPESKAPEPEATVLDPVPDDGQEPGPAAP
jgi:hypothetical protein